MNVKKNTARLKIHCNVSTKSTGMHGRCYYRLLKNLEVFYQCCLHVYVLFEWFLLQLRYSVSVLEIRFSVLVPKVLIVSHVCDSYSYHRMTGSNLQPSIQEHRAFSTALLEHHSYQCCCGYRKLYSFYRKCYPINPDII